MASLPPPTTTTTTYSSSSSTLISTLSSCPFFKRPAPCIPLTKKRNHLFQVSCKGGATDINDDQNSSSNSKFGETTGPEKLDRRNVVIGLGGLYRAASLGGTTTAWLASASPAAPDITKCGRGEDNTDQEKLFCCPPATSNIIDYKLPPPPKTMRVRLAAHLADKDPDYIKNYRKAVELMKGLDKNDPRSFYQQANVHCAYCDGFYDQVGFPNIKLQVHSSWLFFPFHRWYLYFYERILGSLIGDPNFVLPFWNWDDPRGMQMPLMYTNDRTSPLYDQNRNPDHQPPMLIDLNDGEKTIIPQQVPQNLNVMYRYMITNSKDPHSFYGDYYVAGTHPCPGAGSIEHIPHNIVHDWCGDPRRQQNEDMGTFYSAGRDPIFFAHHSNVDRMWTIWTALQKAKRKPTMFTDPDWLEAWFLFYDENKQLVRVKVSDCLDNTKLGYVYQDLGPLPWLQTPPTAKVSKELRKTRKAQGITRPVPPGTIISADAFPIKLDKVVRVTVTRPNKSRSEKEKEERDEKLKIQGIEFDSGVFVKFDVYVNDEGEGQIGPENTEFAGSFVNLPHMRMKNGNKIKTSLSLSISDLIDDLGAEDDDSVVVTLVPKFKSGIEITLGSVKIVS